MLHFCRHLKNYYLDPKYVDEARQRNRKQWEEEKCMTENVMNIVTNLYIIKYSGEKNPYK